MEVSIGKCRETVSALADRASSVCSGPCSNSCRREVVGSVEFDICLAAVVGMGLRLVRVVDLRSVVQNPKLHRPMLGREGFAMTAERTIVGHDLMALGEDSDFSDFSKAACSQHEVSSV